ncbi:NERD domain-containing protein, partial [Vibrio cholerae]
MIVKEKTHIKTSNFKQDLGNQVENDVAFYLR